MGKQAETAWGEEGKEWLGVTAEGPGTLALLCAREQVPSFEQEPTGDKQCEAQRRGRGKEQFAVCDTFCLASVNW